MVAGRADGGERGTRPAFHHCIDPRHRCAGTAQRGLGAAGAHRGVGVELDHLSFGGTDRQDRLHVGRGVDAGELFGGGVGGGLPQEIRELGSFQRGQHGTQAVGAFRMIRASVVPQAGRMRDQRRWHVSLSVLLVRCGVG